MKENLDALMEFAKEDHPDGDYPDYIVARRPSEDEGEYLKRLEFLGLKEA